MILETICTALVKSETRKPEVDGMIVVPYLFCLLCRIFQNLQIAGLVLESGVFDAVIVGHDEFPMGRMNKSEASVHMYSISVYPRLTRTSPQYGTFISGGSRKIQGRIVSVPFGCRMKACTHTVVNKVPVVYIHLFGAFE